MDPIPLDPEVHRLMLDDTEDGGGRDSYLWLLLYTDTPMVIRERKARFVRLRHITNGKKCTGVRYIIEDDKITDKSSCGCTSEDFDCSEAHRVHMMKYLLEVSETKDKYFYASKLAKVATKVGGMAIMASLKAAFAKLNLVDGIKEIISSIFPKTNIHVNNSSNVTFAGGSQEGAASEISGSARRSARVTFDLGDDETITGGSFTLIRAPRNDNTMN